MSDTLSFGVSLDDKLSGPSSRMEDALERLDKTLKGIDDTLGKLDKSQKKTADSGKKVEKSAKWQAKSWGDLGDKLKQASYANKGMLGVLARGGAQVAALAGPFIVAGAAIGGVALAFGAAGAAAGVWVAKSAAFKQDTLTSLELMTGSAKAAKDAFSFATRAGRQLGSNDDAALERLRAIASAGFNAGEQRVVFSAVSDVEARGGNANGFLDKLSEVRSAGKITADDLKDLAKNSKVELPKVFDALTKQTGMTRAKLLATMQSDEGLDPNAGILGVLTTLADANGGKLGAAAERGAQTFTKRLGRILSAPTSIFNSMDLSRFTGFAKMDQVFGNLDKLLEPGSAAAKRLEGIFLKIDTAVGNLFSRWTGPDGTKILAQDIDNLITKLERFATIVERISKPLGFAVDTATSVVAGPSGKNTSADKLASYIRIASGIDGIAEIADWISDDPKPSPLKKFGKKRRKIPAFADGGYVNKPTLALIGEAGPEIVTPVRHVGPKPTAATFGRSVTVNAPITINGNATREEKQKAAEEFRSMFLDAMSDLSLQVA